LKQSILKSAIIVSLSLALIYTPYLIPRVRILGQETVQASVSRDFNRQLTCLTENIYYEASYQPYEGKLAVAQVTINRVNSGVFPSDVCSVVKQKNNGVCQFSWVCKSVKSLLVNRYEWQEAEVIARRALTEPVIHEAIHDENIMYYHASYVHPDWKLKQIMRIGEHIFYK
jgi:spore germination cell wall hydrolase CwlJ-like protein